MEIDVSVDLVSSSYCGVRSQYRTFIHFIIIHFLFVKCESSQDQQKTCQSSSKDVRRH